MDHAYHIAGANGQTYGPVPLDQLLAWVRQGRVVADTLVFRTDQADWQPARHLPELALGDAASSGPAPVPGAAPAATAFIGASPTMPAAPAADGTAPPKALVVAPAAQALDPVIKSGASWFYWIAGLSLVNTVVAISGGRGGFVVGLGITQVFDAFALDLARGNAGGVATWVPLLLDAVVYGVLIALGVFASRRRPWAFLVGMIAYTMDAGIFVLFGDWLAVAFHVFALFFIYKGFTACREYHRLTA